MTAETVNDEPTSILRTIKSILFKIIAFSCLGSLVIFLSAYIYFSLAGVITEEKLGISHTQPSSWWYGYNVTAGRLTKQCNLLKTLSPYDDVRVKGIFCFLEIIFYGCFFPIWICLTFYVFYKVKKNAKDAEGVCDGQGLYYTLLGFFAMSPIVVFTLFM